jgi:hypothetical protein
MNQLNGGTEVRRQRRASLQHEQQQKQQKQRDIAQDLALLPQHFYNGLVSWAAMYKIGMAVTLGKNIER